jgi:hypothetical protein
MGSAASLLLSSAVIIAAVGGVGVWFALKRPAQALQRRQRSEALAAAEHYTPAERVSPYGPQAESDPCAPGLSDGERVEAMRALLLRGDQRGVPSAAALHGRDEPQTTTPMAWNPTLPPDEAEVIEQSRTSKRPRVREGDHEHITV